MAIEFEPDYQKKLLRMSFNAPYKIESIQDIAVLKTQWLEALKSWHSPYKALIDCNQLEIVPLTGGAQKALIHLKPFFEGFFLKKAVCFSSHKQNLVDWPFLVVDSEEEACAELGIRNPRQKTESTDLRSNIGFENHFQQHTVECSFHGPVVLNSAADVAVFKSKLMNNLMLWHSAWNLLIDCSNVRFEGGAADEFKRMLEGLKGFYLKKTIGYNCSPKLNFPFESFRSRHKAAAQLEFEGAFSGAEANCQSKKTKDSV